MKKPAYTKAFEKDTALCVRRGWNMEKFKDIARLLLAGQPLPANTRPHPLSGKFTGYMDCHISSDWVLIYKTTPEEVLFARMGTHSDLF